MKNQIPFTSDEFCTAYSKALQWLTAFNSNLSPDQKIRNWNVEYVDKYLILKF